ncbi:MAG TPA: transaldolase family protein, partial [Waddliaceae bacterium]
TIDRTAIEHAQDLGLLHGVTTNPAILAQASEPAEEILDALLNYFSGPLAVQVTLRSSSEMVEQGKDLYEFSSRIIVKIPATQEGLEAIFRLSHGEIPVMATAIFEPLQAFLAIKAGARYVVPYFSHLGERALPVCHAIQRMLIHQRAAKLLVASLATPSQVSQCAESDFSAVTLKSDLFNQCLMTPPQTLDHLNRFEAAWKEAPPSNLLALPQFIR